MITASTLLSSVALFSSTASSGSMPAMPLLIPAPFKAEISALTPVLTKLSAPLIVMPSAPLAAMPLTPVIVIVVGVMEKTKPLGLVAVMLVDPPIVVIASAPLAVMPSACEMFRVSAPLAMIPLAPVAATLSAPLAMMPLGFLTVI